VKEVIYLAVSQYRVERMNKSMPDLKRGEIPVKLLVEVDAAAFREPVIEMHVHVTDWRDGLAFADPELRDGVITEAEAEVIRRQRLAAMQAALESRGYSVTAPDPGVPDGQ
jgi:D-serine deaminase-like pyridoxal phosphate-dependent protein